MPRRWVVWLVSGNCHAIGVDMCRTCSYRDHMPVMVQIRDMPEALHRRLKSRAALAGMSLSEYLLNEIRALAEQPTLDELRERLRSRAQVSVSEAPARAVRGERARR